MTMAEYNRTRVIPERKRATLNGKRSVDAFIKSVRERMVVEHPEVIHDFDTILTVRLMIIYYYFTKYIVNRWDTDGMMLAMLATNGDRMWYTDNILDGYTRSDYIRDKIKGYMMERADA